MNTNENWINYADVSWFKNVEISSTDSKNESEDIETTIKSVEHDKQAYTIYDAAQLAGLAKLVNEDEYSFTGITIKLYNDIDLSVMGADKKIRLWTPIGIGQKTFDGTFDGCGYKIIGMSIHNSNDTTQNLFGQLGANGIEKNYTLENLQVIDDIDDVVEPDMPERWG